MPERIGVLTIYREKCGICMGVGTIDTPLLGKGWPCPCTEVSYTFPTDPGYIYTVKVE